MRIVLDPVALKLFLVEASPLLLAPVAELVKARQEQLCPVDSHANRHMRDNIAISPGEGFVDVGPTKQFFYARMVETGGNTHRKPRPFIRPSAVL